VIIKSNENQELKTTGELLTLKSFMNIMSYFFNLGNMYVGRYFTERGEFDEVCMYIHIIFQYLYVYLNIMLHFMYI
jgi:hypothetical protein